MPENAEGDNAQAGYAQTEQGGSRFSFFKVLVVFLLLVLIIGGLSGTLLLSSQIEQTQRIVVDGLSLGSEVSIDRRGGTETIVYDFHEPYVTAEAPYSSSGSYFWKEHVFISRDKDENGVLQAYIDTIGDYSHNPSSVALYGLEMFGNYCELEDSVYLEEAQIQADFLIDSMDQDTGAIAYPYDDTVYTGDDYVALSGPWVSADAQGRASSLFSRLYKATGDEKYRSAALLAVKPFERDVKEGGVARDFLGHTFFETYPTDTVDFALNGHLTATIGLYDVWKNCDDLAARALYEQSIETIEFSLPYFDSQGISLFKLAHLFRPRGAIYSAGTAFHLDRIAQLEAINQEEQSERIQLYIDTWTAYVNGEKPSE